MTGKDRVVILGDFMIDVWWVVSERISVTSEFHGGIEPLRRVSPHLLNERAGAAAVVARVIREFAEYEICGLGLWDPADDERWMRLAAAPGARAQLTLRRLRTRTGTPLTTIVKTRIFLYRGSTAPILRGRLDQELEPNRIALLSSPIPKAFLGSPTRLAAVVVADFCKGSVTRASVRDLHKLAPSDRIRWFVETKSARAASLFGGIKIDTLFLNRREATNLANALSPSIRVQEIPPGPQPTGELLKVGETVLRYLRPRHLVITLGDDGAAAFWHRPRKTQVMVSVAAPDQPSNSFTGVSAGDVFVGRWIAEVLTGRPPIEDVLKIAGATAHRWCAYQDGDFWTAKRSTDAPLPARDILSSSLPNWRPGESRSAHAWRTEIRRRTQYPEMLSTVRGKRALRLAEATRQVPGYVTLNPELGAALRRLRKALGEYRDGPAFRTPYVSLLVAQPGAGKTALARSIAAQTDYLLYEVNIGRLVDYTSLLSHFDQIASLSAGRSSEGRLPLLFLDEFDAKLGGSHIFAMLLSPLQEGVYEVAGHARYLGKVAVVLAASAGNDLKHFRSQMWRKDKFRDLWTRINGVKIEVPSMTPAERVYLAVMFLRKSYPDLANVSTGVLDRFAGMTGATARDIQHAVEQIRPRGGELRVIDTVRGSVSMRRERMVEIE